MCQIKGKRLSCSICNYLVVVILLPSVTNLLIRIIIFFIQKKIRPVLQTDSEIIKAISRRNKGSHKGVITQQETSNKNRATVVGVRALGHLVQVGFLFVRGLAL